MDGVKQALQPVQFAIERFINDPVNHDYLVLIKAMRNGIVYGCKIRFPHALVMVFLFKSGSLKSKVLQVLAATRQHATNLATFAFTYKSFMLFLRALPAPTPPVPRQRSTALPITTREYRKEGTADSFMAGLLAGYLTFGRSNNGVNQQIVMYVFARVCFGLAKLAIAPRRPRRGDFQAGYGSVSRHGYGTLLDKIAGSEEGAEKLRRAIQKRSWPVFASVSWAMVMWLFRWHPDLLQPSLKSSMTYLYEDSGVWDNLRNFLVYNK